MEQVYREIDWRVVFLLSLLIPLGVAVERAAAGEVIVEALRHVVGVVPPLALAAIFLCAGSNLSQVIDRSVSVIFLGPIALAIGKIIDADQYALLMAVTLGSSLAFVLPTSCRSNMLVSGAGGYKVSDFVRVGIPFTLAVGSALLAMLWWRDL